MSPAQCPVCGCETFYCKSPDDEYETTEFKIVDGAAVPTDPADGEAMEEMTPETETFCDRCSWHAPFKDTST